jgi:hypothetical protein
MQYVAEEAYFQHTSSQTDTTARARIVHNITGAIVAGDEFCDLKANWDLYEARERMDTVIWAHWRRLPEMAVGNQAALPLAKALGPVSDLQQFVTQSTFVVHAATVGALKELERLKAQGGALNDFDAVWTPLMAAVRHHRLESAEWLIQHGARVDAESADGRKVTALMLAAENGDMDMMRLLLNFQCNINASDAQEQGALHFASQACRFEAIRLLLAHGAKIPDEVEQLVNMLWVPTFLERIDIVSTLIKAGANLRGCHELLELARECRYPELVSIYQSAV